MRTRRIVGFGAIFALILGAAVPAGADERDELQEQLEQNSQQLESLRSQLEGVDTNLQDTYIRLETTRQNLLIAEQELVARENEEQAAERKQQQLTDRLAIAEADLADIEAEIAEAQLGIEESQASLGELARTAYQNGGTASANPMSILFGSTSSRDFLTRYSALDSAVRSQSAVLDTMSELEAITRNAKARQDAVTLRVAELKAEADQAYADAQVARQAAADKRAEIASLNDSLGRLAGDLEAQKSQIQASQEAIALDNADLQNRITEIDEENRRAEEERQRKLEEERKAEEERDRQAQQRPTPPRPTTPAPPPPPSGTPSGTFVPPVPRPLIVTSPYGYRIYPITGGWFMHYGVDLRSACGNSQVATAAGTVSATRAAYGNGTHGNQVIINHGIINGKSTVSVYNHLSSFAVRPGQTVAKGQVIGYTGATGMVTGCHVHFEVWFNGRSIDPMTLF